MCIMSWHTFLVPCSLKFIVVISLLWLPSATGCILTEDSKPYHTPTEQYFEPRGFYGNTSDFTLVTALFDIGRHNWHHFSRTNAAYLEFARHILKLESNFVIYTEEKFRPDIERLRKGKMHKTEMFIKSKEDFELSKHFLRIRTIMSSNKFKDGHEMLAYPEGFSPWYVILTNTKPEFVYNATVFSRFNTKFYYWIDIGYGHGNKAELPATAFWAPKSIMEPDDHRVSFFVRFRKILLSLKSVEVIYKKAIDTLIVGGFFGGTKHAVTQLYFFQRQVFERLLENGVIDDDQTIAVACILEMPSLFRLLDGDFPDVFKLE